MVKNRLRKNASMKRNYPIKNITCVLAVGSLLAVDCAIAVREIDLSAFGSSVDAVDWTWNPATSNLSGTEAPGAVLFPTAFSGADLTTLSNYGGNPSNLRFNLTGFVTTPPPGAFSITLESTGGSLSVTPVLWSSFGTTSSTFTTAVNTTTLPGFAWNNIIGWTLDSGGSGNTVNATFTSLTVSAPATEPHLGPVITSPAWPVAVVGQPFSFQIAASGEPTSYGASNLPSGLTLDTGTGAITGTPNTAGPFNVTLSATNAEGTGTATSTLNVSPSPETNSFLAAGSYRFQTGAKLKLLGIDPIGGANYHWFKGGIPIRSARSHGLDLTPGSINFGPAQAGVYQLRQTQGTNTTTAGTWIITHDDPTILVYDLALQGTKTTGVSEDTASLGGFILVDRSAVEGDLPAILIITRTDRVGRRIIGRFYWLEDRPDVGVSSNGPMPGTAKLRPTRTLVAGLRGTQFESPDAPESPIWLEGDRDLLWLSGNDGLINLNKTKPTQQIIAPLRMTGILGTARNSAGVEIDNFSVTANLNLADTLKARIEGKDLEQMKAFIVSRLEEAAPPFTPGE